MKMGIQLILLEVRLTDWLTAAAAVISRSLTFPPKLKSRWAAAAAVARPTDHEP